MNEVIIKEIKIKDNKYKIPTLINRLLRKDLKLLILTKYDKNNNLILNDNIQIIDQEKIKLEIDKEYILKCKNIIIGQATYKGNTTFEATKIYINNEPKDIKDLFKDMNDEQSTNKEIETYTSGLFKYYYDFLIQCLEDNNNYFFINKMTAASSYIIAKKYFEDKGYIVSQPNVFIKNFNVEFDMLLLNKEEDKNKIIFDTEDVKAIVELKASGIVGYSEKIDNKENKIYNNKNYFQAYITYDQDYQKRQNKLKEYDKDIKEPYVEKDYETIKKEIIKIPFIYFCFYESNSKTNEAYKNMYNDIKELNKKQNIGKRTGIYLTVSKSQEYYTIPYDI